MNETGRLKITFFVFFLGFIAVIFRLGWWQIYQKEPLLTQAENQRWEEKNIPAKRGEIFFADQHPLALSLPFYNLFAFKPELKIDFDTLGEKLSALLENENQEKEILKNSIIEKLNQPPLWIPLSEKIEPDQKEAIDQLGITGLHFEEKFSRFYPEASQAAHLLGFVGKNEEGKDQGYFGLEGFYEEKLKGEGGKIIQENDALGRPIILGNNYEIPPKNGANLILFLDRQLQWLAEQKLEEGVKKYGAKEGLVIITNPKEGSILAMAAFPDFDPNEYSQTDPLLFLNPAISATFEPGSIFKPLIMAIALENKVVTPETICPCDGPLEIGEYQISTWNNQYYPQSTMTEIIQHSDNVGMAFVAQKLGLEKTLNGLEKFGFGKITGIDLQGEVSPTLREAKYWSPIDLATLGFGQGIAITPIQMVQAMGAIANNGKMISPRVVASLIGEKGKSETFPKNEEEVISPQIAKEITRMMVNAVNNGEAKWTKIEGAKIAGKTGTAQIPISGHYDPEKTVASFIGFAPAENPQFLMLVTLKEPTASPWASETAAPLWFEIAREIFTIKGISPK
ncbi:penicillin-binding protein 2 [Candidatus Shapirobacteria bacterium]|nr:penicillin-binding protein 2 [Candidatus Shapirobacteria bacterium]